MTQEFFQRIQAGRPVDIKVDTPEKFRIIESLLFSFGYGRGYAETNQRPVPRQEIDRYIVTNAFPNERRRIWNSDGPFDRSYTDDCLRINYNEIDFNI